MTEPWVGPVGSCSFSTIRKFGSFMVVNGFVRTTFPSNQSTQIFLCASMSVTFRYTWP